MVFEHEYDAHRVLEVLPKRVGKYGLKLHPEKTRLIRFRRPPKGGKGKKDTSGHPQTFDLLGFSHYWAESRQGNWVILRKTSKGRLSRALHEIAIWCKRHRHEAVRAQHKTLTQKMMGHYQYYGIYGNSRALGAFYKGVRETWRKWLNRRSNRARMTWERFAKLSERYVLPNPHIVHYNV